MFATIQYQSYRDKCLRKRWNIWFHWDYLKSETTQIGETHILQSPNQNQIEYIV